MFIKCRCLKRVRKSFVFKLGLCGTEAAPACVPLWFRKEEAALNKFHHLQRKVAAVQRLTPLIDAALIMIIACLCCCCFASSNPPCSLFQRVSYPGIHGCRCPTDVSPPCNLLAANQQPPFAWLQSHVPMWTKRRVAGIQQKVFLLSKLTNRILKTTLCNPR